MPAPLRAHERLRGEAVHHGREARRGAHGAAHRAHQRPAGAERSAPAGAMHTGRGAGQRREGEREREKGEGSKGEGLGMCGCASAAAAADSRTRCCPPPAPPAQAPSAPGRAVPRQAPPGLRRGASCIPAGWKWSRMRRSEGVGMLGVGSGMRVRLARDWLAAVSWEGEGQQASHCPVACLARASEVFRGEPRIAENQLPQS